MVDGMASRSRTTQLIVIGITVLGAVVLVLRVLSLHRRFFDLDEFQHLHMAWLMAQGLVPYVDFYEHHTPLLHLLLMPIGALVNHANSALVAQMPSAIMSPGSGSPTHWPVQSASVSHGELAAWLVDA